MLLQHISFGRPFGSCFKPNFQYTTSMINEVAATSEETTAYALGSTIGTLLNLKRMVEQNMTDYSNNLEGMRGLHPMWSKSELMDQFDRAINKLNTITYPYKI